MRILLLATLLVFQACGGHKATPVAPAPTVKPQSDENGELGSDYDALVSKALSDYKMPGVAIAVIRGDQDLLVRGYGFANISNRRPVTPDTLFAIGSMSKAFTSAAAALLVDRGQLSFDDKIKTILPDFQLKDEDATQNATLRQLLSHQSGLPRHDLLWYSSSFSRKELYDRLRFLEPTAKLGEKFQYNNLTYLVAGLAVAARVQKPWEDLITQEIFKPLGMDSSKATPVGLAAMPDVSAAHDFDAASQSVFNIPAKNTYAIGPAGGIQSSAKDLTKWMRFQLGESTALQLSAASLAELHKGVISMQPVNPETPELSSVDYALGWMSFKYRGNDVLMHGGSIDGFDSNILLLPAKNIGIVVLQNSRHVDLTSLLTFEALDRLLGVEHTSWIARFDAKLVKALGQPQVYNIPKVNPSWDWSYYRGSFADAGYGSLRVVPQSDQRRVVLQLNNMLLVAVPYHDNIFVFPGAKPDSPANQVAFEFDANGTLASVSMSLEPTAPAIRFIPQAGNTLSLPVAPLLMSLRPKLD